MIHKGIADVTKEQLHKAAEAFRKDAKYIRFELVGRKPKTNIWNVVSKDGDIILGTIEWFGRWRGYAFFPEPEMVFERTCLRDIADFIEAKNKEQRDKRKEI